MAMNCLARHLGNGDHQRNWHAAASRAGPSGRAPDLILADYHLGGEDTGRTIKALRAAAGSRLPAVMVTAYRNAALARNCARLGIRVLEKPVRPEELQQSLIRAIAIAGAP